MKFFAKRISAVLLSLALIMTMMPLFAFAEGESGRYAIEVFVNGTTTEKGVSRDALNEGEPQIVPFPAQKGKKWSYYIVKGPSYESVLKDALGIESLADIEHSELVWRNAEGVEQRGKDNKDSLWVLPVSDLMEATDQFRLVNSDLSEGADGYVVTEAFDKNPTNVKVDKLPGSVVPVIAGKYEDTKTGDYEAAKAKLTDNWDAAPSTFRPFLGGNADKEAMVKDNGKVKDDSVNFLGRFSTAGMPQLNINIPEAKDAPAISKAEIKFTDKKAQTVSMSFSDLTDAEAGLLYGKVEWTSDNPAVAKVDAEGTITPASAGSCTVTGKIKDFTATCKVTVDKSAFPAIVNGQKAKVGGSTYKVLSAKSKTAALVKAANKKSVSVPATIKVKGVTLKVTEISAKAFNGKKIRTVTVGSKVKKIKANAFKGSKATKLVVKTKALSKASVKGSLKGSKIKTVQVKAGKKYVKKYQKYFTKKNAGKKVTVK